MNLDLAKIDAIIFDLGGVILDINIEGVFKKFKDAGIGNGKPGLEVIKTNKAFTQFETGKITPEEFRDEIRKDSKNDFTDEMFDSIWNSMLLPYSKERIVFLEKIRLKYRTFLMSNTNIIHFETYSKTLNDNF
ncbi:MAG: HAD family phosphatase, partial [Bacteroidales bacterium]|nr:HAD family phosphatase [Bacteroidales bacterium]